MTSGLGSISGIQNTPDLAGAQAVHQLGHLGQLLGCVGRPGQQHQLRLGDQPGGRAEQDGHALLPGDAADEDHVGTRQVDAVALEHLGAADRAGTRWCRCRCGSPGPVRPEFRGKRPGCRRACRPRRPPPRRPRPPPPARTRRRPCTRRPAAPPSTDAGPPASASSSRAGCRRAWRARWPARLAYQVCEWTSCALFIPGPTAAAMDRSVETTCSAWLASASRSQGRCATASGRSAPWQCTVRSTSGASSRAR